MLYSGPARTHLGRVCHRNSLVLLIFVCELGSRSPLVNIAFGVYENVRRQNTPRSPVWQKPCAHYFQAALAAMGFSTEYGNHPCSSANEYIHCSVSELPYLEIKY